MAELIPVVIMSRAERPPARLRLGSTPTVPAIILRSEATTSRFLEFFTLTIRNKNTRRAYYYAVARFTDWAED
jgi:hypothetical protein